MVKCPFPVDARSPCSNLQEIELWNRPNRRRNEDDTRIDAVGSNQRLQMRNEEGEFFSKLSVIWKSLRATFKFICNGYDREKFLEGALITRR